MEQYPGARCIGSINRQLANRRLSVLPSYLEVEATHSPELYTQQFAAASSFFDKTEFKSRLGGSLARQNDDFLFFLFFLF